MTQPTLAATSAITSQRVADHDGVDEDFLRTLVANAIEISWAPLAVKQRLREELAAV